MTKKEEIDNPGLRVEGSGRGVHPVGDPRAVPEQLAVLASSPLLEALLGPFVLQLENVLRYRGTSLIRNHPPPLGPP